MKNGFTPELLEQAKTATSAAELLALAAEKGIELTPAEAASYYVQLHPKNGALLDEELDNVAGGGCRNQTDGRLIVTSIYHCDYWICKKCHQPESDHYFSKQYATTRCQNATEPGGVSTYCGGCKHSSGESTPMYCNHPANCIPK